MTLIERIEQLRQLFVDDRQNLIDREQAIKALQECKEALRWIPVEERLPEPDVPVLVSWGKGDMTTLMRYVDVDVGWYWLCLDSYTHELADPEQYTEGDDFQPKYWALLPTPPESE
jgi:hypothetical protein